MICLGELVHCVAPAIVSWLARHDSNRMLNALHRRVNEQVDNWTSSADAKTKTLAYEGMVDRAYKECDTGSVCNRALDAFHRQLLEESNRDNMRDGGRADRDEVGMEIPGGWTKLAEMCEGCYFEDQGCGFECIDDLFSQ